MRDKSSIDRHAEPPMTVYPVRLEAAQLETIRKIAKAEERTRQSIVREAIRLYLTARLK